MSDHDARGWMQPFGREFHVVLGLSQDEYDAALAHARSRGEGVEVSKDPGWHSHPILGITGHLHPDGLSLHTHMPEWTWGPAVPIRLDQH